jgi:hypothetical protein
MALSASSLFWNWWLSKCCHSLISTGDGIFLICAKIGEMHHCALLVMLKTNHSSCEQVSYIEGCDDFSFDFYDLRSLTYWNIWHFYWSAQIAFLWWISICCDIVYTHWHCTSLQLKVVFLERFPCGIFSISLYK